MEGTVLAKTLRSKLAMLKEQSKGQCGWETGKGTVLPGELGARVDPSSSVGREGI